MTGCWLRCALLQHRSFTLSNPNRTRALVGAFAQQPARVPRGGRLWLCFSGGDPADLNTRNPQVAARMVDPLIRLKRYDAGRQALMRQQLESLLALESLSGDLYEKITRALEA
ncbi:aminopeptidase N C-terminal domain-containing protein [Edwardsiella anguillarum]|nr:aminopeptidase N C-terminal domain-containing protein [Edwardsiella anguillarum]